MSAVRSGYVRTRKRNAYTCNFFGGTISALFFLAGHHTRGPREKEFEGRCMEDITTLVILHIDYPLPIILYIPNYKSFNIYAVCISVSALGIIAKLALAQEKKIMARAKERARHQFIHMFDIEEVKDSAVEDEDDEEQCSWAEMVIDDKNKCDIPDNPRSIIGALWRSLQSNLFNFIVLGFIAALLKRVEGWSFIDTLYYWNCTATTIGFGDVCPSTQIGRLLSILFIPLSVVTLGETIASVFAFVNGRIAAKAEKDFLRREITLSDLDYLDVNDDGKVCELDFITFMLVAMQKVDSKTMKDLQHLFHALDAGKDGYLQK